MNLSINFIIQLLCFIIIVFSSIGYGILSLKFFKNKSLNICLGFKGLIGIFYLIIYSYLSHFFYPHGIFHNFVVLIMGLIFFIYFFIFKKDITKYDFYKILFIFLIIFIGLLIYKNHDDFPYYHFPYTFNLTQNSLTTGIGTLNHGFRTPSSIFYLNSLFYLPFIKYYSFNFGAALILGFSNLYILNIIFENLKRNRINYIFFFALLSFVFINVFFYRLQEHGTDRSAQILVFLLVINLFILREDRSLWMDSAIKISILLALIISFKSFYILYLILLLPLFYYLNKDKIILKSLNFFKMSYFYSSLTLILLVLITFLLNTGCIIYPVSFTCFENLSWSLSIEEVERMKNWYEQWSKGGATPNFRTADPSNYIQKFNWVSNWMSIYFFNKVSDFLLGIIFLITVFFVLFFKKNNKAKKTKVKNINLYIFVLLILLIEWFYNHPALRYGGFVLISSIIFIPISIFISSNLRENVKKKIYFVIFLTLLIFSGRNINRIIYETNFYKYKPFSHTFYFIDNNHFRLDKEIKLKILKNR